MFLNKLSIHAENKTLHANAYRKVNNHMQT